MLVIPSLVVLVAVVVDMTDRPNVTVGLGLVKKALAFGDIDEISADAVVVG